MKRKRCQPYKLFVLGSNGSRTRIEAKDLIVELRPGVEVQIDLAPHPNFEGELVLETAPQRYMQRRYEAGFNDTFATIFGAANVLHVMVERRIRGARKASKPARDE